jgi:transposase
VVAGELSVREATPLLGVCYRHARRLVARFRACGVKGLVHAARGRPSNRTVPPVYRAQVLELVRQYYGGPAARGPGQRFGPTLAAEHLWTDHGLRVPVTTLRRWMRAAGLWSRRRRARPRHQRRERKAHFGELVQLDGSPHAWFEGRGPPACAMTMVDDATSRTLIRFSPAETTWAAAEVLQAWIAQHGLPQALYCDWKNVYQRPPTLNERSRGEVPLTQFGRMCAKLGIRLIAASTPQAKGRVERTHGTHQDRLIKKLRLAGIDTLDAANAFLEETYLPVHNARFAVAPASPVDYHRPRHVRRRADADIFCLESSRIVGADAVVQYHGRALQLAPSARIPKKSQVLVRELRDGTIHVVHVGRDGRERHVRWTPAAPRLPKPQPVPVRLAPTVARPAAHHPWRQQHVAWMDRAMRRRGLPSVQPPIEILTPSHP